MSIWSVRNGYLGMGAVAALVEAETVDEARAKGAAALAAAAADYPRWTESKKADYGIVRSVTRVEFPYVGDELP